MATLLILENQAHRRNLLTMELEKEGHTVIAFCEEELLIDQFDTSVVDLLILNLYPDSLKALFIYNDFKNHYPDFPVIISMLKNLYALKQLKIEINDVLKTSCKKKAEFREKNNIPDGQL
jgi:DNA-binding NtrC family response regulator